jgi:7-cyano-7-deazaguanine reductase
MSNNPLGKPANIPDKYAPQVLFGIPRQESRQPFIGSGALPFRGADIWNAWELTWLDRSGKPEVGIATILVPADSTNIIESKSLKLYLNSFANAQFESAAALARVISADLAAIVSAAVSVSVSPVSDPAADSFAVMPGLCIDALQADFTAQDVDPRLLTCDAGQADEELHSHLLRSLCPVTGQPDQGSILIRYAGAAIRHESLLQYLVSFRQHNDFHEACVERIFVDLMSRCQPQQLSVYARYNRRGGIDINPFRSNYADAIENLRLWRQ